MTAERWHQVRDILYAASCLEGRARLEYLDERCDGDAPLRHEVEKLLAALEQCGGFLEPDSPEAQAMRILRIGPYLLLEEAGRGGMGVVYRAVRDDEYRQEVAIKLVRGGVDVDFLIPRFRVERQALALLNHPNIARLLDGGTTTDGWPYLVMEWVDGEPVTAYSQRHELGVRDRLHLFLDICDAVEHAHQKLVVHRDLKPSNILITREGTPKLLDFGIAKIFYPDAGSDPLTTLAGPRLLTPDYASPEQLRGEPVATATDVYSLGAVLYELLTGRRALKLESRTPAEIERVVCMQEPIVPSAATESGGVPARELRGDLDNIVLKAMQKDPRRRYGSVGQFSDDIRRHLQGRPVTARKDTLAYRMSKFARRHRVGVAAAALIICAVTAGAATTLWQARVAVEQRARAERRFNDVRRLANSFLFEFDDAIRDLPGSTAARSLVVMRALEYLDSLMAEARGDRSLQLEIASAYERVGEVQGDPMFPNLGDSRGALLSSQKALTIRETLSRSDPGNPDLRLALASIHRQIGDILAVTGDSSGAVAHSATALAIYESLAAARVADLKFQQALIVQNYQHANLLTLTRDVEGAAAGYQRAVELSERLVESRPSDTEAKIHLATSLDGLGGVLQDKGNTLGALETRRKGLAIREQLAAAHPENAHYRRQLAFSHHNVGLCLVKTGDLPSALDHFRRELSLFETLGAADLKDAQARRNRSLAHKQIGDVLMRTSDVPRALEEYRKAFEIDKDLAAAEPGNRQALLDLSLSEGKVGSALAKSGKSSEGLTLLHSGIKRQEALGEENPADNKILDHLANSYTRLAACLLDSGNTSKAIEYYRKAVANRLNLSLKNPAVTAYTGALAESYSNLGNALASSDPAEALKYDVKAVQLLEPLTAGDTENAEYRTWLATARTNGARVSAVNRNSLHKKLTQP
ncbi:MAG TPA: protein kinase [Bryobacteraceae bacterium]|nr:protein kinase [Bryobacteraceae bacterium]